MLVLVPTTGTQRVAVARILDPWRVESARSINRILRHFHPCPVRHHAVRSCGYSIAARSGTGEGPVCRRSPMTVIGLPFYACRRSGLTRYYGPKRGVPASTSAVQPGSRSPFRARPGWCYTRWMNAFRDKWRRREGPDSLDISHHRGIARAEVPDEPVSRSSCRAGR